MAISLDERGMVDDIAQLIHTSSYTYTSSYMRLCRRHHTRVHVACPRARVVAAHAESFESYSCQSTYNTCCIPTHACTCTRREFECVSRSGSQLETVHKHKADACHILCVHVYVHVHAAFVMHRGGCEFASCLTAQHAHEWHA